MNQNNESRKRMKLKNVIAITIAAIFVIAIFCVVKFNSIRSIANKAIEMVTESIAAVSSEKIGGGTEVLLTKIKR